MNSETVAGGGIKFGVKGWSHENREMNEKQDLQQEVAKELTS